MADIKFVILVGDGMADYPMSALGGRTPLEAAHTPHMDRIAACRIGLAKTVPEGMGPGSDVANLSILGYDPVKYNTGRGPLEAASMGIKLSSSQVAFRMNLVTLEKKSGNEIIMISHSAGDIPTAEATEVVKDLKQAFQIPGIDLYPGVAYRHLLVWDNGPAHARTIPPHDVLGQNMAPFLGERSDNPVPALIERSWKPLAEHPVNIRRRLEGKKEANSIWLWGQGKTPQLPSFMDTFGIRGGVISAVDLIRGIGVFAGFTPIAVEGATGYLNTNYMGKAKAALKGLETLDLIFLHVEAPDEAGHSGNYAEKIEAIEHFDQKVVGTVLTGLEAFKDYRIMVVSDHLTPIALRTHTAEPTPFAWATREELHTSGRKAPFTEQAARDSGTYFERGYDLIGSFLEGP